MTQFTNGYNTNAAMNYGYQNAGYQAPQANNYQAPVAGGYQAPVAPQAPVASQTTGKGSSNYGDYVQGVISEAGYREGSWVSGYLNAAKVIEPDIISRNGKHGRHYLFVINHQINTPAGKQYESKFFHVRTFAPGQLKRYDEMVQAKANDVNKTLSATVIFGYTNKVDQKTGQLVRYEDAIAVFPNKKKVEALAAGQVVTKKGQNAGWQQQAPVANNNYQAPVAGGYQAPVAPQAPVTQQAPVAQPQVTPANTGYQAPVNNSAAGQQIDIDDSELPF